MSLSTDSLVALADWTSLIGPISNWGLEICSCLKFWNLAKGIIRGPIYSLRCFTTWSISWFGRMLSPMGRLNIMSPVARQLIKCPCGPITNIHISSMHLCTWKHGLSLASGWVFLGHETNKRSPSSISFTWGLPEEKEERRIGRRRGNKKTKERNAHIFFFWWLTC